MKKNIKNILLFVASTTIFLGCSKNDNGLGKSNLIVAEGVTGIITLNSPLLASQTVNEVNEGKYKFTVTLNKVQSEPIVINIIQVDGDADSKDFTFDNTVTILANNLVGEGNITIINNDDEAENDESFKLKIGTISTSNATIPSNEVSFKIINNLSPDINLIFNFDYDFTVSGTKFNLYKMGYDIDFEVRNEAGVDTGNTVAQTAKTPEVLKIAPTTFSNGTYTVKYLISETGHVFGTINTPKSGLDTNFHDPFKIPINVDYLRIGGIRGNKISIVQPLSTSIPNATGDVIKFKVNNGIVTIL